MEIMGTKLKKLMVLHVMAVVFTVGCLSIADVDNGRALFLLPAGALMVAVFGTLKDLCLELLESIRRR